MVGAAKGNGSSVLVGKYGKLMKQSTRQHHPVHEEKSGLAADTIGSTAQLDFQKQLATGKRRETIYLSNQEKEQWIEKYLDRETGVARN